MVTGPIMMFETECWTLKTHNPENRSSENEILRWICSIRGDLGLGIKILKTS